MVVDYLLLRLLILISHGLEVSRVNCLFLSFLLPVEHGIAAEVDVVIGVQLSMLIVSKCFLREGDLRSGCRHYTLESDVGIRLN